jgi:hypothetical protein
MVISERYQKSVSDKSSTLTPAVNQIEIEVPRFQVITNGCDNRGMLEPYLRNGSPSTNAPTGQSNNNARDYNNITHIDEPRITQNVNIYVDTRNANNNSNQNRDNHSSIDPEGSEMQTSKSKPILLSKTNVPQITGTGQTTPINVLCKRPCAPNNPRVSTEQHLPLNRSDRPVGEIDRNLSTILIAQKHVRKKLLDICQGHSCGDGDKSLKIIIHQRNEDNDSLGDANPKRLIGVSADQEKFCRSDPENTWQEHKSFQNCSRVGSETMVTERNYANIRKFISGKNELPKK